MMSNYDGTLIVIDGADGSGKATQTELLVNRLKNENEPVETIEFPQYQNNLLGELIGECLDGQYGEFADLAPKIASVLYAADRFESSDKIQKWLSDGKIVVADRYVSSNQMHQGGKFDDPEDKRDFLEWLDKLEYDVFDIPRPNAILYLDVSTPITQKLLKEANDKKTSGEKYTKRRVDVVESDEEYTKNSRSAGEQYLQERKKWRRIQCTEDGDLLSKQTIHEKIYTQVKEIIH